MYETKATRQPETAAKFTPGPWAYEPSSQMRYSWIVLTEDFDEDANRGTVLCRTSDGISEADARLISAAPDLYAACKALVSHDNNGRFGSPDFPSVIEQARAAIAKAEGGAA